MKLPLLCNFSILFISDALIAGPSTQLYAWGKYNTHVVKKKITLLTSDMHGINRAT